MGRVCVFNSGVFWKHNVVKVNYSVSARLVGLNGGMMNKNDGGREA